MPSMMARVSAALLLPLSLILAPQRVRAQQVHEIQIRGEGREGNRFDPAVVQARPGDVLDFRAVSGAPHSVVFEPAGISDADQAALNSAMVRRSGNLTSPILTASGHHYRFTVPRLTPGRYRFFCLAHRAFDERGELDVTR